MPGPRLVLLACLAAMPARAAELTVLSTGAFKPVAAALIPGFEARTGDTVVLKNDTAGALLRRIGGNEAFDVVLLTPSGLEQLAGKIAPGSQVRLAKSGIGVAVRTGAAVPDVHTVEQFKQTLLHARAVAMIDPASGGSSGIYLTKLFRTLGIAPNLLPVNGGLAAEAVVDGRADVVLQQMSELASVPGVTLAGPLPPDIQNETVYAGAVAAGSTAPAAARSLLDLLAGPDARAILKDKGLEPP